MPRSNLTKTPSGKILIKGKSMTIEELRKNKARNDQANQSAQASEEPKSPSQKRDEKKAETREQRITLKDIGMAKGGRAGFKAGSKGCKLAMKGKGRAYGKNS